MYLDVKISKCIQFIYQNKKKEKLKITWNYCRQ